MKWLTISINPPPLDGVIVVRTSDFLGFGVCREVIEVDPEIMEYEDLIYYLTSNNFIEWGDLKDE